MRVDLCRRDVGVPSIAWTERRSAPRSSRWLANEWRSVCGDTDGAQRRASRGLLEDAPQRLPRQRPAVAVHEQASRHPPRFTKAGRAVFR